MKIICNRNEIVKRIERCTDITEKGLDEDNAFLFFRAENKEVEIITKDDACIIGIKIPGVKIIEDGRVKIHAIKLNEIIKNLVNTDFILFCDSKDFKVKIESGGYTGNMRGLEFVMEDRFSIGEETHITISVNELKRIMYRVCFAASDSTSGRTSVEGVHFEVDGTTLRLVATDSRVLATASADIENIENIKWSGSVPKKSVAEAIRLLNGTQSTIDVYFSDKRMIIKSQDFMFITQLYASKYPDLKSFLSMEHKIKNVIDKKVLIESLKRILILSPQDSYKIKMTLNNDECLLESQIQGFGNSTEKISLEKSNNSDKLVLNGKYLLDILTHFAYEDQECKFILETNSCEGPCIIKSNIEEYTKYFLMPLRA